jgi:hypothetical protein
MPWARGAARVERGSRRSSLTDARSASLRRPAVGVFGGLRGTHVDRTLTRPVCGVACAAQVMSAARGRPSCSSVSGARSGTGQRHTAGRRSSVTSRPCEPGAARPGLLLIASIITGRAVPKSEGASANLDPHQRTRVFRGFGRLIRFGKGKAHFRALTPRPLRVRNQRLARKGAVYKGFREVRASGGMPNQGVEQALSRGRTTRAWLISAAGSSLSARAGRRPVGSTCSTALLAGLLLLVTR